MLSIEYDLGLEDRVAFNLWASASLPLARERAVRSRVATSVLGAFLVFAAIAGLSHDLVGGSVAALGAAVLGWFLFPWSYRRTVRRITARSVEDPAAVEHHWLSLEADGLRERTSVNDTLTLWAGIQRVDETAEYAFISIGPLMAFVVPKRGQRDAIERFVGELRQRLG